MKFKHRKYNPKFFDDKVKWKNKHEEKTTKMKMKKHIQEFSKLKAIPKTNKRKNELLLNIEKSGFLERM